MDLVVLLTFILQSFFLPRIHSRDGVYLDHQVHQVPS
jgi:hypothetical protein